MRRRDGPATPGSAVIVADEFDPTDPGPAGPRVTNLDDHRAKTARPAPDRRAATPRVPPRDIDAERALLGAAMLDPIAIDEIAKIGPDAFYLPAHVFIADTLIAHRAQGDPIDPVTIAASLTQRGVLEVVGGHQTIADTLAGAPAPSAAPRYARIVADHAVARRLLGVAGEIAEAAYAPDVDLDATLARARQLVDQVVEHAARAGGGSSLAWADIGAVLDGKVEQVRAELLTRSDGQPLLYTGRVHAFRAEPGAAKSWLACKACLEVIGEGGTAVYLDYEDSVVGIVGRMLALGGQPAEIRTQFAYVRPETPIGTAEHLDLERRLGHFNPDLVVIDGVAEALAKQGLDEESNSEVARWVDDMPRRITAAGPAVLMIDHVTKAKDQRGRYSRGAGHKLAAIDGAQYELRVIEPFSRGRAGKVVVVVDKDRPGDVGATGETVAVLHIKPLAGGERVDIAVDAPEFREPGSGEAWKPTRLMDRICDELTRSHAPLDAAQVLALLRHPGRDNSPTVRQAIQRLIVEGTVRERREGHHRYLELARPRAVPNGDGGPVQSPFDEEF